MIRSLPIGVGRLLGMGLCQVDVVPGQDSWTIAAITSAEGIARPVSSQSHHRSADRVTACCLQMDEESGDVCAGTPLDQCVSEAYSWRTREGT
jgi:hypothetical protein